MSRKYDRTDLEVFASDVQKTGREDRGVHQRRYERSLPDVFFVRGEK
jgi:hypothetical protein